MNRNVLLALSISALSLLNACTPSKPQGFSLNESPIRYETRKFEDPNVLADVNGIKFTRDQILDKSPVIKDLTQQREEALIGLSYMKIVEKLTAEEGAAKAGSVPKAEIDIYLPDPKKPMEQILARFDRKPLAGLVVRYVAPAKDANETETATYAKSGSIVVKSDDLDPNNTLLQSIEKRRFVETGSQLNRQLARILINEEANKAKTPIQEYIDKTVLGGQKAVATEDDLKTHLKKIGFAESELTPELKEQFLASLSQNKEQDAIEAYVAKNVLKGPVPVAFEAPVSNLRLSEEWKPVAGSKDAPISMVAFAGTTCPDCPAFITALKSVVDDEAGYVKLNWIHNFNDNDGVAAMMAQASLCVDAQKSNHSLKFLNDFSKQAAQLDENAFYDWTKANGLSTETFKACFVGQTQKSTLDQHLLYAKRVGIVANPSLWIDGQMLEGIIREDDIKRVITDKIAEKQVSPFSAFIRRMKAKFGDS